MEEPNSDKPKPKRIYPLRAQRGTKENLEKPSYSFVTFVVKIPAKKNKNFVDKVQK